MTLVKMLETRKGTEDGFTIRQFQRDEIYEIRENLARSFFAAGFAVKFYPENDKNSRKRKRRGRYRVRK